MPPADKENQRNRQFEGKRVVDARKAGPGGEVREERNNQRNTEYRRDDDGGREGGRGRGRGRGLSKLCFPFEILKQLQCTYVHWTKS